MKRVGILSLRWATAVMAAAALALPQVLRAQGPVQGIKVHGHWVVEVRNADGTLHLQREFENALTGDGRVALAGLLVGRYKTTDWVVRTNANGGCGSGPCATSNTTMESGGGDLAVVHGSFVATSNGQVAVVNTEINVERYDGVSLGWDFSSATLAAPISVQATQTVSVTVTFSFQ